LPDCHTTEIERNATKQHDLSDVSHLKAAAAVERAENNSVNKFILT